MTRSRPSSAALAAAAAWGGIAVSTYLIRKWRHKKIQAREERVAANGGLLPEARNVVQALELRAGSSNGNKVALVSCDGTTSYTWKEYYEQVQKFAGALKTLGANKRGEDCGVAVHAFNEPRWFFCAIGALAAEWTVSGIYLTNTYEQAKHVIRTSHVRVLVIENETMLQTTYKSVLQDFPELTVVLLIGGDEATAKSASSRVCSYSAFLSAASSLNAAAKLLTPPHQLDDNAVASLVYTSGTTGNPKAVELTHANIRTVCAMMHARIPLSEDTIGISYLPLSHSTLKCW